MIEKTMLSKMKRKFFEGIETESLLKVLPKADKEDCEVICKILDERLCDYNNPIDFGLGLDELFESLEQCDFFSCGCGKSIEDVVEDIISEEELEEGIEKEIKNKDLSLMIGEVYEAKESGDKYMLVVTDVVQDHKMITMVNLKNGNRLTYPKTYDDFVWFLNYRSNFEFELKLNSKILVVDKDDLIK